MDPSTFSNLPFELVERIIHHQEPARIAISREVCKTWKTVIDNSPVMLYVMTLAKYGLKDNPVALPVSAAERLDLLSAQLNGSWVEMQPGQDTEELNTPSFYLWDFFGNVFAQVTDNNLVLFHQFASPRTNRPRLTWEVPIRMRGPLGDFGMDPSQDLLILARSDVSPPMLALAFRTMSTGHEHPSAKLSELTIPIQAINTSLGVSYHISVCGTFAGFLLNDEDDGNGFGLFIINWKTGELCMDLRPSDNYELISFAFASESQIAVCAIEQEVEEGLGQGIRIYNFLSGQTTVSVADRDSIDLFLKFPGGLRDIYNCVIRSDPTPAWPGPGDTFTQFYDDPDELVYTILIRSMGMQDLTLVVRRATLLEHLGREEWDVPWSDWGERGASSVEISDTDSYWTCRTFGSLMVVADVETEVLTLYDFNQKRAKLFLESSTSRSESAGESEGTEDDEGEGATEDESDRESEPESGENDDSFELTVNLPYRERVFPILSGGQDALIGLDCILIVDDEDEGQFRVLSL
ncbi:hypothetical protein CYLTODRAFT_419507 [Cylindrobasidium torrendii FP15055 ss-10]|uniref:F-box domain-containing protein n=1 Tax=Cylindrobasidium torrendii FP15055 ss-10 TaxID=1314674 RepID=A0A0D7BM80_9AGAR|nr:hypothetical protein CYLTODRAFT_419507 [Cylindrobasidium torrendii FP15055 ss-10]